jgi:hypothetical protein
MTSPTAYSPFLAPDPRPVPNGARPRMAMMNDGQPVTITPEMAKEWLARHDRVVQQNEIAGKRRPGGNRPIRWNDVDGYARDMKAGHWDGENGETLKIACDNTIPDGQHRLYACIKAQVPFRCLVVTGVAPEAQDTIDTGIKRKVSDQLMLRGESNYTLLAALARWSWRWLRGVRVRGGGSVPSPTPAELTEYIDAAPHLRDAAAFAARARMSFRSLRGPVFGMAWLLFHEKDSLAANVFLERVLDGADIGLGHPAHTLRERLRRAYETGERLTEHEQLALVIIAWNAFREDRKLSIIKLPAGGLTPRNFPGPV